LLYILIAVVKIIEVKSYPTMSLIMQIIIKKSIDLVKDKYLY